MRGLNISSITSSKTEESMYDFQGINRLRYVIETNDNVVNKLICSNT